MIVNYFVDHLAYTFESDDSMFMLGMRLVKKSQGDMISAVDVTYNDRTRLLYGIEGYRPLADVAGTLNNSELAIALIKFINSIQQIENNDFLKITAIDINYNRLYYDVKNKSVKFILLPVNYECDFHDGEIWSASFRRTLLILLNYIFAAMPQKYEEIYHEVMDETKTDGEIIEYLSKYDFGIQLADNSNIVSTGGGEAGASLVLEHNGSAGSFIFMINKPEFILGKSKDADGVIINSNMVSRNHCRIIKSGSNYMVEDLNSTNGTSINGYVLNPNEMYYINNGDKLVLADIEFTVILE